MLKVIQVAFSTKIKDFKIGMYASRDDENNVIIVYVHICCTFFFIFYTAIPTMNFVV